MSSTATAATAATATAAAADAVSRAETAVFNCNIAVVAVFKKVRQKVADAVKRATVASQGLCFIKIIADMPNEYSEELLIQLKVYLAVSNLNMSKSSGAKTELPHSRLLWERLMEIETVRSDSPASLLTEFNKLLRGFPLAHDVAKPSAIEGKVNYDFRDIVKQDQPAAEQTAAAERIAEQVIAAETELKAAAAAERIAEQVIAAETELKAAAAAAVTEVKAAAAAAVTEVKAAAAAAKKLKPVVKGEGPAAAKQAAAAAAKRAKATAKQAAKAAVKRAEDAAAAAEQAEEQAEAAAVERAKEAAVAAEEAKRVIIIGIRSLEREIKTIHTATHSEEHLGVRSIFDMSLEGLQLYENKLQNQIDGYKKQLNRYEDYKKEFLGSLNVVSASLTALGSWGGGSDYKRCGESDSRVQKFLSGISPNGKSIGYELTQEIVNDAAKRHFGRSRAGLFLRGLADIVLLALSFGYINRYRKHSLKCESTFFSCARTRRCKAALTTPLTTVPTPTPINS